MNRSSATLFGLLCAAAPCAPALTRADAPSTVNADEALRLLLVGNQRFVGGNLNSVTREEIAQRRAELAQGQKPFAIVLCCSDSRVGPEIVFGLKGDPVQNAVRANVEDIAARLRHTSPVLSAGVKDGRLKVAGAVLALETGKVELVPDEAK